jgi:nicotinate-nucleotide adenylyltransferase
MNRTKTVIFGGSFDPLHNGHLALAAEVLEQGLANEVWFMVTPQNPHKQDGGLSDERDRLAMVQLAIEGIEGMKASDFEFQLPRPSYTLNTLRALEEAYPDREFSLLIGADNWEKFDRWYKGDEIVSRFGVIVYPRDNGDVPELPTGVSWLPATLYNVSSTMIRDCVAAGKEIAGLVTDVVAEFIEQNKLYRKI